MYSPAARLSWWIFALVGCGALLVGSLMLSPRLANSNVISGLLFVTLFQQTLLAAAWVPLGPGPMQSRIRWSLAWAGVLGAALCLGQFTAMGGVFIGFIICLSGLWLFGQLPFWMSVWFLGVQIQHVDDPSYAKFGRAQFGIGQMMMLTAVIGVILGIGRIVVAIEWSGERWVRESLATILLLTAQVVMSIPLVLAALLPRLAIVGVAVALMFMVAVTYGAVMMASQVLGGGVKQYAIYWCNVFGALWTLAFVISIRNCGFRLSIARPIA